MASIKVSLELECQSESQPAHPFDRRGDVESLANTELKWGVLRVTGFSDFRGPTVDVDERAAGRYVVTFAATATAGTPTEAAHKVEQANEALEPARKLIGRHMSHHDLGIYGHDPFVVSFVLTRRLVQCPIPRPERLEPGITQATDDVVMDAIKQEMTFREDRLAASDGLVCKVLGDGQGLELNSARADVIAAAKAFLRAAAQERIELGRYPPAGATTSPRIAAAAVAAIALVTLLAAPVTASVVTGTLLFIAALAIAAAAARLSAKQRWKWAKPSAVLIGMTPMIVIVIFTVTYAYF